MKDAYQKSVDGFSRKWFQYILDHPDKSWHYCVLSENANITWDIMQANPDKPWNYPAASFNPNITCGFTTFKSVVLIDNTFFD